MWIISKVWAENFMSFEKAEYSFQEKTYVIQGDNKSDGSQKSNGSGKSSFTDIIAVSILGYSLSGRDTKDMVRWDSEDGRFTVGIELLNSEHNMTCLIKRTFYSGSKSAELVLLVNGNVPNGVPTKKGVKDGVDVKDGSKYILNEILGINETDLLNYYLISTSTYSPFLEVNTDKKLAVIGRFTNTKAVDKSIEHLNNEIDATDSGIYEYESMIDSAKGYIQALQDAMGSEEKENEFNKRKENQLRELYSIVNERNVLALELSEEVAYHEKELETIQEPDPAWLDEKAQTESALTEVQAEHKQLFDDMKTIQLHIQKAELYLAGLISCPNCEHKFTLEDTEAYTEEEKTEMELLVKENSDQIESLRQDIATLESALADYRKEDRERKEKHNLIESSLKYKKRQLENANLRLEDAKKEYNECTAKTYTDETAGYAEQIKAKQGEISSFELQLEELKANLDRDHKWVEHFENFKFFLGNKPISIICNLVNQYLKLSGSDLGLFIEGFKKLRSGELRQSLEPVIFRNWLNPQKYKSFSAGERCRLNIAVDLAFQQLINSTAKYGGLNFYLSDEALNSLDSLGVQTVASAFNGFDKTILLVTHSGSDLNYNNVITIKKEHNKSTII